MQFKTEELIMLVTGEYDDTIYSGPVKVLKPFDIREEINNHIMEFTKEAYKDTYRDEPSPESFIKYLIRFSFIEDIPCKHIHIGSYGDINLNHENNTR